MALDQVEFGGYELNLHAYRLRRAGRTLKLERIPMELLFLLVEGGGNLVAPALGKRKHWGLNGSIGYWQHKTSKGEPHENLGSR
jgi:DNA-binding response OmpR family regulator